MSQDFFEEILVGHVQRSEFGRLRRGVELESFTDDETGITAKVLDRCNGRQSPADPRKLSRRRRRRTQRDQTATRQRNGGRKTWPAAQQRTPRPISRRGPANARGACTRCPMTPGTRTRPTYVELDYPLRVFRWFRAVHPGESTRH